MVAEKIIKSKERVKKYAEVYTPAKIVKLMCDMLERENPDVWTDITSTILEPTCGNGNFLVEIAKRRLIACKDKQEGLTALSNIYAIDLLPDNIAESKARVYAIFVAKFGESCIATNIINQNIICCNSLKFMSMLQKSDSWADAKQKYSIGGKQCM